MKFRKKIEPDLANEDHLAETLEAYTCQLNGEKLSGSQEKFLESFQEAEEFIALRQLIDLAHESNNQRSNLFVPSVNAKRRARSNLMEQIQSKKLKRRGKFQPIAAFAPDPIGSASELAYVPPPVDPAEIWSASDNRGGTRLTFQVVEGQGVGNSYNIDFPEISIGRASDATIVLKKNELAEPYHARLLVIENEPCIVDLDTGAGTYVDGVRRSEPTPIEVGTVVAIGDQTFETISVDRTSNALVIVFKEIEGHEVGQTVTVQITDVTIGRSRKANAMLIDSTKTVSREHARLSMNSGKIYITDLNSTNGTYVDGKKISEATKLATNMFVRFGGVTCKIMEVEAI